MLVLIQFSFFLIIQQFLFLSFLKVLLKLLISFFQRLRVSIVLVQPLLLVSLILHPLLLFLPFEALISLSNLQFLFLIVNVQLPHRLRSFCLLLVKVLFFLTDLQPLFTIVTFQLSLIIIFPHSFVQEFFNFEPDLSHV